MSDFKEVEKAKIKLVSRSNQEFVIEINASQKRKFISHWFDFSVTCEKAKISENDKYFYKPVSIPGTVELRFWKHNAKITHSSVATK